ncbi:MAG: histone deacetylase [Rhodospirillaceae bacterium]|nr:histone deacetylase [Rhodospirillaceae bacterium]MBT4491021.1 histone deacetylase [Rhodospirillaceae bacterium]MBT5195734.1 histone deacetylase [Rhodospirillaceae bacterium]MBT5898312.1 histone deacetylase [Rhodospirillaceae bacterium]MBT6429865.1 histone deacetylase [Rhodospirillaceae bacterium]
MAVPIVHHPSYTVPLPHRRGFPMGKYGRLIQLLRDQGLATAQTLHEPDLAPRWWLELAHDSDYVDAILSQTADEALMRRIGLPISSQLADRAQTSVGGTVLAARLALQRGIAANSAGGSHHAGIGHGAGYCVFNDVAVAARVLQAMGLAMNMLVVDLDVHQGDGTAEIFRGDGAVFTFSMHCQDNFPARKQPGDRDIGLPVDLGDDAYLEILAEQLTDLLPRLKPDLVFYNAGVDPHVDDRLGKLSLSDQGLARRDALVIGACAEKSIPIACVLGGGYDNDAMRLAGRHALLYGAADHCYRGLKGFGGEISHSAG